MTQTSIPTGTPMMGDIVSLAHPNFEIRFLAHPNLAHPKIRAKLCKSLTFTLFESFFKASKALCIQEIDKFSACGGQKAKTFFL